MFRPARDRPSPVRLDLPVDRDRDPRTVLRAVPRQRCHRSRCHDHHRLPGQPDSSPFGSRRSLLRRGDHCNSGRRRTRQHRGRVRQRSMDHSPRPPHQGHRVPLRRGTHVEGHRRSRVRRMTPLQNHRRLGRRIRSCSRAQSHRRHRARMEGSHEGIRGRPQPDPLAYTALRRCRRPRRHSPRAKSNGD